MAERRGINKTTLKNLSEFAQPLHERAGQHMSWWIRFAIAIFADMFDFVVNIIGWIPVVGNIAHTIVNGVQALIGTILLGGGGVFQIIEMVASLIPGVGFFFEFIPMLTIACFFMWMKEAGQRKKVRAALAAEEAIIETQTGRKERGSKMPCFDDDEIPGPQEFEVDAPKDKKSASQEQAQDDTKKIALSVAFGLVIGVSMWWVEFIPIHWILGVLILSALLPVVGKHVPYQSPFWVFGGIFLFLAIAGGINSLRPKKGVEEYRPFAWHAMVDKGDTRVQKAREDDKKAAEAARKKAQGAQGPSAGAAVGETAKGVLDGLKDTAKQHDWGVPALNDFFRKEKAPKQPSTPLPSPPTPAEPVLTPQEITAARLGLGTEETKLFSSDYVLDRAKSVRKQEIGWWDTTMRISVILLGFCLAALAMLGADFHARAQKAREGLKRFR